MTVKLINGAFESIQWSELEGVDLVVADPPDNIGLKYEGFKDKQHPTEYAAKMKTWLGRMADLTDGPIFFTFNEKWTREVEDAIDDLSIPLIQRLQWYYTFGQDQTRNGKYALCYRPIYWLNSNYVIPENIKVPSARLAKYNDKRASKGGKMPQNVWEFPRICGTFKERRKHCPTQLPESLVERIVKGHCRPGGRVLDPFLGSGTTAIVCKRLDTDCIGIDVSRVCIDATTKYISEDRETDVLPNS